ncbi:MAG: DUF4846 domain-containing protein [Acidobacteria bacterium]|nr:DUF4846 domain-containing protein [Acidobacteriota bacterium]
MRWKSEFLMIVVFFAAGGMEQRMAGQIFPWLPETAPADTLDHRIPPPKGYERVAVAPGSFADWLRHLPLREGRPPVCYHDGREKVNQSAHAAVVNMDIGARDLQQCADTIIRLRAEYLYAQGRRDEIVFAFTSGHPAEFRRWTEGFRPRVNGNDVCWVLSAAPGGSYEDLQQYLRTVYIYAGTWSLARQLQAVPAEESVRGGDAFILGGFPGHAVLVVDLAENPQTGQRVMLLAQGYTPAQDVHILRNAANPDLSPWFDAAVAGELNILGWPFERRHLRRWPD